MLMREWLAAPEAALIVGSGPSAPDLKTVDLSRIERVAVNNAWRVRDDFDYVVYPGDFPADRHPPESYKATRIDNHRYMPAMNAAGGIIFCGATMAFAAGYWAAYSLKSHVIGFYASDMVYTPGKTHFYGQGTADPLREDVSLQSLEAKSARLFCWALERGKLLVNCSTSAESRLVFPRVPLHTLRDIRHGKHGWSLVIDHARKVWAMEAKAPFDAQREDYWLLADAPGAREFIAEIDREWLAARRIIEYAASYVGISRSSAARSAP